MSLTADQLAMRATGITATDATGITGVNRFWDPIAVYLSKTDPEKMAARKAENPDQKEWGHTIEDLILHRTAQRRSLCLVDCGTIRSAEHTWALATPDKLVLDPVTRATMGVAEAKNVGFRMMMDWRTDDDGEDFIDFDIPDYVRVQVAWQMLVTKTSVAYVGALLAGRDFKTWEVHQEDALAETLLNVCGDFWHKNVMKRIPPAPGANKRAGEAILAMFPNSSGAVIDAPAAAEGWAEQYWEAKRLEKFYKEKKGLAENQLKLLTGSAVGMVSPNFKISWKTTASGGIDWKGLAERLAPETGIPAKLVAAFKRGGYRRFLFTPAKDKLGPPQMGAGGITVTSADEDSLEDRLRASLVTLENE